MYSLCVSRLPLAFESPMRNEIYTKIIGPKLTMRLQNMNHHKNASYFNILLLLLLLTPILNTANSQVASDEIEHVKVFFQEGRYGGWPANVGIWSWDNEIVVGFINAEYRQTGTFHTYDRSTARTKFARSTDGGHTWTIEDAYERGHTARAFDHELPDNIAVTPGVLTEKIDFTHPDFIMTLRFEDTFHRGPTHFYYSYDRGHSWEGPYRFPDLYSTGNASRPDYIIHGKHDLSAFLTLTKVNGYEGRVAHARTSDGGLNWEIISWLGPEPAGFDIMPSSVRLSDNEIITVIRTRTGDDFDLLTAYLSEDNGVSWNKLRDPVTDTGRGGSPPALVKMEDGRLALAYAFRSEHGSRICVRFSSNNGRTWTDEIPLRLGDGANRDVGYPRMVQRPDGKLVVIYYWNNALGSDSNPYRYVAATIFDPDNWK
jgi:hypothetical protein